MQKKKKGEKENKQKTNGHGKHGEKKGKTGGTTIELSANTTALSKKQNKSEAKVNENNREKSKSRKVNNKLGWPVHQRIVQGLIPFLTGRMFARRTYFGHFDEL